MAKTEPDSVSLLLLNSGIGKANGDLGMNNSSSLQIPLSFKVSVWCYGLPKNLLKNSTIRQFYTEKTNA